MIKLGDVKVGDCSRKSIWYACSDCGKERWVELVKGEPVHLRCPSCAKRGNLAHHWKGGVKGTKLYSVWKAMRHRCFNHNNKVYKYYGRRGITICDRWLDFTIFRSWANSSGYVEGLSIDRIDNDGDYEPENCQWLTKSENTRKQHIDKIKNG